MITHWQNILKGKRMSKRNITFIIMIITLMTLPLSACGKNKNNISTDNSQKLQSESGQEYDDGRDAHMIPAGESQTMVSYRQLVNHRRPAKRRMYRKMLLMRSIITLILSCRQ